MATRKTTTLLTYLRAEARRFNIYETFDPSKDQFITNDDLKLRFMGKIMVYEDAQIKALVNERVFLGLKLTKPETDDLFKQWFMNTFLTQQIDFQTIDAFRAQLAGEFVGMKQYIEVLFENYKDFLTGGDNRTNKGTTSSRSNTGFTVLPQDTAQMNLDTDVMNYPDSNGLTRGKAEMENTSTGTKFDPQALDQMREQFTKLKKHFGKALFYKIQ